MSYYKTNYLEISRNGNQKSFDCVESPQSNECYLNNKSLCHKKPRKVIIIIQKVHRQIIINEDFQI